MDPALVVAFVVAAFLLSVAPGPDMLFIVANAAAGGRRAGLVSAVGMSTGLAVHTVAAALGLGALIAAAPEALAVIRVAGAGFLVYLAVSSWRASRAGAAEEQAGPVKERSLRKLYAMATLTNLANPKVVLFYLAFLPQFLSHGHGAWPIPVQLLTLGVVFIVVGLSVDGTVGFTAGSLADKLLGRPAVRRRLERASSLIFGGLAVRLALDSR
ncbi:LysE family translocator [Virgisporangium aurantiacum]|uniref:Lysine transporter LysE n=1 Tax=Virgisporangium aurantiacum TaxID=175570 RepID=A0A8J3ZJT5_9ACTN|nr:LysE family translocator [Virgisporangium aurantiacum]GIJ63285.1 lysine transporter LysE [Virgisporangium aurantiacum]